jgi:serine/threonine protein kinase/alpha-tubulin suppressor-like RCC1 family protein
LAEEATLVEIRELEADYEILGELGRGGMSIVYLARDRELGRDVAIKVIHTASGIDDETIARQLNEARTVAQLQHPNVVAIHAVKRLSTRGLALVMQYIPGRSLERAIHEDGPFAPDRAEAVLIDIAAALAYAHARGVVHRDVKPENIFLNDETGRALLSDFGIALSAEMRRQMPSADLLVGTPAYMSPEQIDGQSLDGRSDLFSLGLVGYEMLLGVRPWVDMNVADVMYRQKFDPLPAIAGARGDVPPRLVGVVERALEKNRDARWESAQAFLSALSDDEWVRERTTQATSATSTNRMAQHLPPLGGSTANTGSSTALHTMQYRRGQHDTPATAHPSFDGELPDLSLIPVAPRRRNGPIGFVIAGGALLVGGLLAFLINPDLVWKHTPSARAFSGSSAPVSRRADSLQQAMIAAFRDSIARAGQEAVRRAADSAAAATAAADSSAALQLVAARDSEAKRLANQKSASPSANAKQPGAGGSAPASTVSVASGAGASGAPPRAPVSSAPAPPVTTSESSSKPPAALVTGAIIHPPAISTVSGGGLHTCTLEAQGAALCWGNNDRGQLGVGSTAREQGTMRVSGDLTFVQIASGQDHTCGVSRTGVAYCWGGNTYGQLGAGDAVDHSIPTKVLGDHVFHAIVAGNGYSCALTAGGEAWCWGRNLYGELGNGSTSNSGSPAKVASLVHFVVLTAGAHHACALDQVGQAYCWGQNTYGQLGDGTHIVRAAPAPILGGVAFRAIAAGGYHSCALTTSGQPYCWGRNSYGQLGVGDLQEHDTPAPVKTSATYMSLAAGLVHSCALTTGGDAFCWGRNTYGQLGDGTTLDRTAPVRVSVTQSLAAIHASGSHTCAVTSTSATLCWGYNSDGQLGDATTTDRSQPVAITPPR